MKHYLYLLAFIMAGIFLSSCTEDQIDKGEGPVLTGDAAMLKISFRNGTVTRALGDPFGATDEEKTITKLSFYVYPEKEADREMVPFQRYVFDMTTLPLEKDSVKISETAKGAYDCTFILREGGGFSCRVVALANLPDDFDETNNLNTYEKLQEAMLQATAMPSVPSADPKADNQYGLVMYAEEIKMIKKSLETGMDFNMQRLPARIDITNRAYDKDNQEDGFVLTSARIVNAKPGSYLIPAATTAPLMTRNLAEVNDPAKIVAYSRDGKDGTPTDGTTDVNGNPIQTDATMDAGTVEQRLWHELYAYENDDADVATATSVEIKGKFRNSPFSRVIPFVDKDKQPVIIERNHRYLIRINPAPDLTDVTFNIQVTDWNAVDTVNVKPTQKVVPELGNYTVGFAPNAGKQIEVYKDAIEFSFDATNPFDTDYKVVPEIGEPLDTDVSWVKVVQSEAEITKAATGYKRTYTVSLSELSGGTSRRAMLLIRNAANVTARDTIHLKQTIYYPGTELEPVSLDGVVWAPVNVGATKIAIKLTEDNKDDWFNQSGYLFQWGRKTPFKYGVSDIPVTPVSYPTYAEGVATEYEHADAFIVGNVTSWFSDYKNTGGISFSPVFKTNSDGDALWPRENDPCPSGWRVPTKNECEALKDKLHDRPGTTTFDDCVCLVSGDMGKKLAIPAFGYRAAKDGEYIGQAFTGHYWSSNLLSSGNVSSLYFDVGESIGTSYVADALSIRCVQDK